MLTGDEFVKVNNVLAYLKDFYSYDRHLTVDQLKREFVDVSKQKIFDETKINSLDVKCDYIRLMIGDALNEVLVGRD